MKPAEIKFPSNGKIISTTHRDGAGADVFFMVASGRADASSVGVSGVCTPILGGSAANGQLLSYRWHPMKNHYRWHMLFESDVSDAGRFELIVTGVNHNGDKYVTPPRTITFAQVHEISSISFPGDEDITDYETDFSAYGDLRAPIDVLSMKYPSPGYGTSLGIDYIYQDYTDQFIWFAQFATVPGNTTFQLTLKDTIPTTVVRHPFTR
jgi:hypothetical protein